MIITPGYTFTDTETVTAAKLNELGQPVVTLEAGDVDPVDIDIAAVITQLGDSAAKANYLHNGNFSEPFWTRGNTAVSCPRVALTYRADHWFCRPAYFNSTSGGACPGFLQYSRELAGPDIKSLHCARLVGMANYVAVDFGQDIPAHLAAALRTTLTLSFFLYNDTNAALTPSLVLETADAFNSFASTTQRGLVASTTVVQDNNWQKYTFTVNCSAYTNITNGLRVLIRFPVGALNDATKAVRISQVKLERGSTATPFVVERDDVHDTATTAVATVSAVARNWAENPQFAFQRWVTASLAAALTTDNFAAERWWVRPAGAATAVISRDTSSPLVTAAHSLKVTGGAGVTTVQIGQNIEVPTAAALNQPCAFSCYIYNGSGTAFTPTAFVDTCDAARNFEVTTNRLSATLDACPNAAWTRVSFTFNGTSLTNWTNGARLYLTLPSGSLGAGTTVNVACVQLEFGVAASTWEPGAEFIDRAVLADVKTLVAYASPITAATTVILTASDLVLTAADGSALNSGSFSKTIDSATVGAGGRDTATAMAVGWYRFYAISDGESFAGILAPAASVLTLPSGYRYQAFLGEVYCASIGPTVLRDFKQRDALAVQQRQILLNGVIGDTAFHSIAAGNLSTMIPPSAIAIGGTMGCDVNAAYGLCIESLIGASNTIGRVHSASAAHATSFQGFNACAPYWLVMGDPQSLSYASAVAATSVRLDITSYQLATR